MKKIFCSRFNLIAVLAFLLCSPVQARDADLLLTGELTRSDHQSYRELPFTVPAGTDRITVEFEYDRTERTTIDLGIFDSQRFRGWSGGNKSRFTLAETDATPSYLPGPLPAGEWRLLLGVPNIREGVTTAYRARIYFDRGADAFRRPFAELPLRSKAGWYRGELHAHTGHSDGGCISSSGVKKPCPLFHTVEAASERGLDFIAVSEHNARSHHSGLREMQEYFDQLLLIPGREITTFYGHANIFGSSGYVDFRVTDGDMRNLQQRVDEIGALMSINHPGLPSDERCMGCGWTAQADFARVAAVEVVNGSVVKTAGGLVHSPVSGIPFWEQLLDQGYRPTAIAGSDNHDPLGEKGGIAGIGRPTTVIFAENLSQPALLAGLKSGRVFIDLQGTRDRQLDISARTDKHTAVMGETLNVSAGGQIELNVELRHTPGATVRLIAHGLADNEYAREQHVGRDNDRGLVRFQLRSDGRRGWLRVEVVDQQGAPLLLSNPIYLNYSGRDKPAVATR